MGDDRTLDDEFVGCGTGGGHLLGGLRDVPKQLHEAASIDGVGSWGRFVHVTLPMISPVILFNVVIGIINAAQVFVVPLVMTGGGPGRSTYFFAMYVYDQAFPTATWGMPRCLAWCNSPRFWC